MKFKKGGGGNNNDGKKSPRGRRKRLRGAQRNKKILVRETVKQNKVAKLSARALSAIFSRSKLHFVDQIFLFQR
jgi:hypothetical protein